MQRRAIGHACNQQGHAQGGRQVHFATQCTTGIDHLLQFGHGRFTVRIVLAGITHRIVLRRDRESCLGERGLQLGPGEGLDTPLAIALRKRCDLLPEFFGDERDDRVGQPQDGFKDPQQRAAGGPLNRFVARGQIDLGQLQVPVAVFVPDELVDFTGCQVESVLKECLLDCGLCALQG